MFVSFWSVWRISLEDCEDSFRKTVVAGMMNGHLRRDYTIQRFRVYSE